ncbi:MAG: hypothetical protein ACLTGJ_06190 [Faecalibacterium prausnitzii]
MQQDRNKSRRPSSSIQQNSARRQGKPRKAYDWTQDRRPSNQDRRRTQGYQEQTLDFSGGNVTFENHSSGYADNSIQFPQQTARRPNNQNQSRRQGQQRSQRPRQNTTAYPTNGSRPRNGQRPQNVQSARRPQSSGRYRPTEANLRSPARREGRKKRRLTRAAVRRRRAIRRLTALALLLCVIGVGVYLTVTMLFKINTLAGGGRWRGGAGGGRLFQRRDPAGAGRPRGREHLQLRPRRKGRCAGKAVPAAGKYPGGAGLP